MTKDKSEKRRVTIEDKRVRGEDTPVDETDSSVEAEAREALDNLDDALLEFTTAGQAESGRAAMAEDTVHSGDPAKAAAAGADDGTAKDTATEAAGEVDWRVEAARHLDRFQRKEAELQNYRKRVQKDLAYTRQAAVEGLLADLFPAFDGLAQAAATFKDKADGEDPLLDGVRRTVASLEKALAKHGIEKINAAPVPFDPELHQVLSLEESAGVETETVVEVYVEGYRLGEAVLKPAMVKVQKPE